MAAKPKPMSQIKQIFSLYHQGQKIKSIARICNLSRNTVKKYLYLAGQSGKNLPELFALDDIELEALLLPGDGSLKHERHQQLLSQMDYLQKELKRTGVNRAVLWSEYRQVYPDGYSYSQFCHHLLLHEKTKQVSLTQQHAPAEKLFIDYAGKPLYYINRDTGHQHKVEVFVAALGYSQFSYVEAVESQKTEDFIAALTRCITFFGGVPSAIVPDNLKAAVIRTDRYEPVLNRLLEDFANHYQTSIIPARSYKPKDKSLAENLVRHSYSYIYAPLRNRQFFSLAELNCAIKQQLSLYNQKLLTGKIHSRQSLFMEEEKQLLKPLPATVFEIKKYKELTVQKNAHLQLSEDKHYYSVPYAFVGQKVKVIYTQSLVHIYHKTRQLACHARSFKAYGYTTQPQHLPSHYNAYLERSPEYYITWAKGISCEVEAFIRKVLQSRYHVEQAYKSCEGIQSLCRKQGKEVISRACAKGLELGQYNYSFLVRIIRNGMLDIEPAGPARALPEHANIRGKAYYQSLLQ
jgi:transposase